MKKILKTAAILTSVLTLMTFVSCQKGGNTENTQKSEQTPSATELPKINITPVPTPNIDQNTSVPEKKEYTIPKAVKVPEIDGKESEGEWEGALEIRLDNKNTWNPLESSVECQGGTFRYLWDESGLYVIANIKDSNKFGGQPKGGSGSYNAGDGIQLAIYADREITTGEKDKMFFFSFCPSADDSKAYVGEHFTYGNVNEGADVKEAAIAYSDTEDGYMIETRIDSAAFSKSNPGISLTEGNSIPILNVIMDRNENGTQALFVDSAWFSAPNTNIYTLGK